MNIDTMNYNLLIEKTNQSHFELLRFYSSALLPPIVDSRDLRLDFSFVDLLYESGGFILTSP